MNPIFERFVKKVIQETDCSREEREDLFEELVVHLECACEDFKRDGHTEVEAARLAMINFGDGKNVGKTLQHAMYPYRREMLMTLSIGSLLLTYSIYLSQLFVMGDTHIGWLLLGVLFSSSLLFLTLRPVVSLNRRAVMNTLLVIHMFVMGAGMLLSLDLDPPYTTVFSILDALIVLFTIVLIFRTTIYDVPATELNLKTGTKFVHYFNLLFGILLLLGTLFFLYAYLIFASDGYWGLWKLFVPLALWGIFYSLQLILLKHNRKKIAYIVTAVQLLLPLALFGFWILVVRGGLS
ncbi:permease prefix domain 1-containing protein [Sporosarcina aquimarina]|uniref:Permease prefix domain 1-containing protein n=1 Tax=Sporosarcina aquimarina TaxID=114975 RepID=A0ABU4G3E2_9BACL|nr:permease prefix domain 1-containing protein [Sporosarcina aquimarina]MDW0110882.1 permease prefix domain 1-containing protein [Sporosarcina aquimarina]